MILNAQHIDRIIEMAWEDRTPFEAITFQFNLKDQAIINLMRREMKPSSFRMWRSRVQGRTTKHRKLRSNKVINSGIIDSDFSSVTAKISNRLSKKEGIFEKGRFKCSRQRSISNNSISKR